MDLNECHSLGTSTTRYQMTMDIINHYEAVSGDATHRDTPTAPGILVMNHHQIPQWQ